MYKIVYKYFISKQHKPSFGPNHAKNLDKIVPSTIFDNSLSFNQPHKLSSHHIAYKRICPLTSHDFNKNVLKDNHFVNTGMSSSNSKEKMHEGASSGKNPRKAKSLQNRYPEMVTYSSSFMAITLEKVKNKALRFSGGIYSELPPTTKFILDNLQRAYTQKHQNLFQKTLNALELHLDRKSVV